MNSAFLPPPAKLVTPQALRRWTSGAAGLRRAQSSRRTRIQPTEWSEVLSVQNLMTVKKRSGLSFEKRVNRVPAGVLKDRFDRESMHGTLVPEQLY